MVIKCSICSENEKKYKCKTCEIPYCSLTCFKQHQENPCEPAVQKSSAKDDNKFQKTFLYTTVDTVEPEKLELLRNSDPLKDLLYNRHLRRLLEEIDTAPDAMKAVRVAMMEPLFVEFADQCLKVLEPPDAAEQQEFLRLNS